MDEKERIIPVGIESEMKKSYIDYAMSVIVGRALPDVRDGLKPVHRRILYAMYESGITAGTAYKKSARVVGDVMGKYHPHGDAAIYDSLVRMAQEFSMRHILIDGQGNFGSVDGDPPAAMRYTEARLDKFAEEMLRDIKKETVNFQPNYDESLNEPIVLPSRVPTLLINGSQGIAVGMATNIPPHNLGEIINGVEALIKNPDLEIKDLMKHVKGPDYPTGGYIYGDEGIKKAYKTGRGSVTVRARVFVEQVRKGKEAIVINAIPYQVNKSSLLVQIADLVKSKKLEGITDIRDESDKQGTRIVLELRRGVNNGIMMNNLYKHTHLERKYGIILLAINKGKPEVMNLKQILQAFIDHRIEVVTRRTLFELKKAEERLHILEGLRIAVENIDAIIELIKKSKDPQEAREKLMKKYHLSRIQAQAILDIRLHRLTSLERVKIMEEYKETEKLIKELKEILIDEEKKTKIIVDEIGEIREKYEDARRSEILRKTEEISIEDLIEEEEMLITVTDKGYIKRTPLSVFRKQQRGGKGVKGMTTRDGDYLKDIFITSTHHYILILSKKGKLFWLKVYDIPEMGAASKGQAIVNLVQLDSDDEFASAVAVKDFPEDEYLIICTEKGYIKKTALSDFSTIRSSGIIAAGIGDDDSLKSVNITSEGHEVMLASREGKSIRFKESDVRPMGRSARGVKGISLKKSDVVVGMCILTGEEKAILTVTEKGYGKKTLIKEYTTQSRGGSGLINLNITNRNGKVVETLVVTDGDEFLIVSASGKAIRVKSDGTPVYGRNTQGVRLMELGKDDHVVGAAKVTEHL